MKHFAFLQVLLIIKLALGAITFIHHSDIQSHYVGKDEENLLCSKNGSAYTETNCENRFTFVATGVKITRSETRNSLYFYTGNTFGISIFFKEYKATMAIDALNFLDPDVMTIGIKDFEYETELLYELIMGVHAPTIICNVDFSEDTLLKTTAIQKSTIFHRDGIRLGVIGIVSTEISQFVLIKTVQIFDEFEHISRQCKALRTKGVQIIIVFGNVNSEVYSRIAERSALVDLIITGSFDFNTMANDKWNNIVNGNQDYPEFRWQNGRDLPILTVYGFLKYLGTINITFDSSGTLFEYDAMLYRTSDKPFETLDKGALDFIAERLVTPKDTKTAGGGVIEAELNNDRLSCYYRECSLGNFVADALIHNQRAKMEDIMKSPGMPWTRAAIAIVPAGILGLTILPGITQLSEDDLGQSVRAEERAMVISIEGRYIFEALEQMAYSKIASRSFFQVSGMHVIFDYTQRRDSRVVSVRVRCANCELGFLESLKDKIMYDIVVAEYIMKSPEYKVLADKAANVTLMDKTILEYVKEFVDDSEHLYPREERRIIVEGGEGSGKIIIYSIHTLCLASLCTYFLS